MAQRAARASDPLIHASVVGTVTGVHEEPLVLACLRSLKATTAASPLTLRMTMVDNSPGLGLSAAVRACHPDVEIVENARPLGFAANHNNALRNSRADYYLITNDDVVFPAGAVERAVAFLDRAENCRVGVVGFRLLNPDGSLQPSTYRFLTARRALLDLAGLRYLLPFTRWTNALAGLLGRGGGRSRFWAHDRTVQVDTFRGAVMLVRSEAAREVGAMDEVSIVGGEESEWHHRFWDRGWSVVFLHDAEVIHYGSQTVGLAPGLQAEYLKGVFNYFAKHRPPMSYYLFRGAAVPVLAIRLLLTVLTGRLRRAATLRDVLRVALTWRAVVPVGPAGQVRRR